MILKLLKQMEAAACKSIIIKAVVKMDFYDEILDKAFRIFGAGFSATFIIVSLMILLSFGVFIAIIVMIIKSVKKDSKAPRLTAAATIAAKRTRILQSHHHNGPTRSHHGYRNNMNGYNNTYYSSCDTHTSTFYYVIFQFESGDRAELCVPFDEYGLLVEGDRGRLTFQGSRYLSFERE